MGRKRTGDVDVSERYKPSSEIFRRNITKIKLVRYGIPYEKRGIPGILGRCVRGKGRLCAPCRIVRIPRFGTTFHEIICLRHWKITDNR